MRGPVDESNCGYRTNTVPPCAENSFNRCFMGTRAESGACNVCSSPCTSCMHFHQARMGLSTDVSSDVFCCGNAASQFSMNEAKKKTCESRQHTSSETSDLLSVSSSFNSSYGNAESKANLRGTDVPEASEDAGMLSKSSSSGMVTEDRLPVKPQCVSNQGPFSNEDEVSKGEGCDGCISCVSGTSTTNLSIGFIKDIDGDRKNASCSSVSASCLGPERFGKAVEHETALGSSDISCDVEYSRSNWRKQSAYAEELVQEVFPVNLSAGLTSKKLDLPQKDIGVATSFPKVMSPFSDSQRGKSPSESSKLKDMEGDLISDLQELPKSDSVFGQSAARNFANILEGGEHGLGKGTSDTTGVNYQKLVSEVDNNHRAPSDEALNCFDQNDQVEKLIESAEMPEESLHSASGDENDESNIMEHDVEVCDICGDAGREDLLAICSRCSDGAEHTYCMKKMLDKVPEGVWLCEECKFAEETENQKRGKFKMVGGSEKNQFSECPSTVHSDLSAKLDSKDADVEISRSSCSDLEVGRNNKVNQSSRVTGKRHLDSNEAPPVAKRKALETTIGSPKASDSHRTTALSRDWSFKNSDKGKVKPSHQIFSAARSVDKISDAARSSTVRQLQRPSGTLSKSFSFSSSNLRPKVVDEAISQKQKGAREPAKTLDVKEGPKKLMGKSLSFNYANLTRPNATGPKVKMLSPKVSDVQELRGFKQAKEGKNLEKKKSFRLDHSTTSSSSVSTVKDQRVTCRGEANLSNGGDSTAGYSDGKLSSLSKSISHLTHGGSKIPDASGEVKRQSLCVPDAVRASSTNGRSNSAEQKPRQPSLKDEPSSSSLTAERTSNVSEILQDGLSQSREPTIRGEKMRDGSGILSRQSVTTGGRNIPCQKGLVILPSEQFSTSTSSRASAVDVSGTRSSGQQIGNGSRLKAAIEAAMLKKPGIYRKNKLSNPSDDFFVSSMDVNGEMVSQDQSSIQSYLGNTVSGKGVHEGEAILQSCAFDSGEQPVVNNVKKPMVYLNKSECSSKAENSDSNVLSVGKVSMGDLHNHASTAVSVPSKMFSIPEHGSECSSKAGNSDSSILSVGKVSMGDLHSHASTAVSVRSNMFSIPEHEYIWQGGFEVHRSGKLPELFSGIQAHLSTCASPKVLEVVHKFSDKVPLNEVARLTTWPTQFHNSGTKDDNIALYFFARDLESYEKNYKCLLESMMKNDLALKGNFDGIELLIFTSNQLPEKSQRWNTLYFLWGVFREKRTSCIDDLSGSLKNLRKPTLNVEHQYGNNPAAIMSMPESLCTSRHFDRVASVSVASNPFAEVKPPVLSSSAMLNGKFDTEVPAIDQMHANLQENFGQLHRKFNLPRTPTSSALLCPGSRCGKNLPEEETDPNCGLDRDHQPSIQVTATTKSITEEKVQDRRKDAEKIEGNLKEGEGLNNRKRMHLDSVQAVSHSSPAVCQTGLWKDTNCTLVDGGSLTKKLKTGLSEIDGSNSSYNSSSLGGHFASSPGASFCTTETDKPEKSLSCEKHFFPLDLRNFDNSRDNSVPWKLQPPPNEDRHLDGTPNLELALGAETKPTKQGVFPSFLGIMDKNNQGHLPEIKGDGEDASSLSLSLSFPFSDKERAAKPVPKAEQLLPERHHVNTSLLLFGGFPDS